MSETEINWEGMLGGSFIKIEEGKEYEMVLANWKPQETFKDEVTGDFKPGLVIDVLELNGEPCTPPKSWTVTSIRAMVGLRPILEAKDGQVKVYVKRTGSAKNTQYEIRRM